MQQRNYLDVAYGTAVGLVGMSIATYAFANYNVGQFSQMGPGMFPAGIGVVLSLFGFAIAIGGALQDAPPAVSVDLRSTVAVLSAIGVFAASVGSFGLFPAISLMVAVASLADSKLRPQVTALLVLALCLFAYLVFIVGLQLPWPLMRWPF